MNPNAAEGELAALEKLVLEVGAAIGENLDGVHTFAAKAGTEFVTETDRLSEELLLAGLDRLFPGEPVVAEESGAHPGQGDRTWYVDPLDGTTNFAHGYPFFCVSVGAEDDQGLVLGAVCAPALDECYLAGRGLGARCSRSGGGLAVPLPKRRDTTLDAALLATGFPYIRDDLVQKNTSLVRQFLESPCHGVRRAGSAALDLCYVGAGRLDGYWEFRLRPWDTAAGVLVARECGVRVTLADGGDVSLPADSVLAAPPSLHAAMLEILCGESRS